MQKGRKLLWRLYFPYVMTSLVCLVALSWYAIDLLKEVNRQRDLAALKAQAVTMKVATRPCFSAQALITRFSMMASSQAFRHVGAVAQHDFHLARRIFRNQGLGGKVLHLAPGIEVLEEGREVVECPAGR